MSLAGINEKRGLQIPQMPAKTALLLYCYISAKIAMIRPLFLIDPDYLFKTKSELIWSRLVESPSLGSLVEIGR